MDLQKEKSRLRQELKNRRESLSLTQRVTAAQEAQLKISQLAEWKNSQVVCLYASFKGELPTTELIQTILKLKKQCVLPKVNDLGKPELYLVKNFQDLELSSLQILEPNKNCLPIAPSKIDFFLVPGIGFDRQGHRLGHGSGFYDRLLSQASPDAFFVGFAYDFQLVTAIPCESHDVNMHALVTPTQIIRLKPAK